MTGTWLLVAVLLPLALALLVWRPGGGRQIARTLAPWAAVPALCLSLPIVPAEPDLIPWLLLGTWVGLDATARLFLFFTAFLWTMAGLHARWYVTADQHRYFFFHLAALCGNLGLIVAQDLASFYLFFALMTFSAYGLVVHDGTPEAYRAGRVYIVMAVAGETLLLAAFLLSAASAPSLALTDVRAAAVDSAHGNLIIALFLAGFGIKAGAVPLHVWLPLAHPVAPTPASAVLSGCMIKAGLLGWLRFLPLGEASLPAWGGFVVALGLVSAFFGVLIGISQTNPKTVLAYSSVSQMGIINVAVGIGLSDPDAWPLALTAIPLYALHHGLAKGALFLSVSVVDHQPSPAGRRRLLGAGVVFPALALIGAPVTSGAVAKLALKNAAAVAPGAWSAWLDVLLPLTAIGTTLLMMRFLTMVAPATLRRRPAGVVIPWALTVVAVAATTWAVPLLAGVAIDAGALLRPYNMWTASWPLLVGVTLAVAVAGIQRRTGRAFGGRVDAGDLLVVVERLWARRRRVPMRDVPVADIHGPPDPVAALAASWYGLFAESAPRDRLARWESHLLRWENAAALTLILVVAFWLFG